MQMLPYVLGEDAEHYWDILAIGSECCCSLQGNMHQVPRQWALLTMANICSTPVSGLIPDA